MENFVKMSDFVWKDRRGRPIFPMDWRLQEILDLLATNQVIVVEAETGAGKTTRIPQALLLANPLVHIWMSEPRRNAVRLNGRRIASELGSRPGGLVGWKLRGQDPVESRSTRLHLRVDKGLATRIRRDGGKLPEGFIIVDEAHERSISIDLLLGLIKEALASSPGTRILITSATIDTKKFSQYFDGAPIVRVAGRRYPVRKEILRLMRDEHHSQGAARAAGIVLDRFFKNQLMVPNVNGEGEHPVSKGAVAVLLPGKEDIKSVKVSILEEAKRLGLENRVEESGYHGDSTDEEEDLVQAPVPNGVLRFICATEILRSSVTARDLIGVIDSLQVKRKTVDDRGVAHLRKIAISKAEADQGAGRAGRTAPGFYIAISFGMEYEQLNPYPQPAILREPITTVALEVAAIGRSARTFSFLDTPRSEKVEVAIHRLQQIGAFDSEERITETGELLLQFPVDPERAEMLVTADKLGVLSETVVTAATLEAEGFFHPPKDNGTCTVGETVARLLLAQVEKTSYGWRRIETPRDFTTIDFTDLPEWITPLSNGFFEINPSSYGFPASKLAEVSDLLRRHWAGKSQSDFVAIVRAYRAFKAEHRRLSEVQVPGKDGKMRFLFGHEKEEAIRQWGFGHFINLKRIWDAEALMYQIREEVQNSPLRLENGFGVERDFDEESLTKAIASGLTDNVGRLVSSRYGDYSGRIGEFKIAFSSVASPGKHALVVIGGVRKIPGRKGDEVRLADLAAPVKPEWLREIMPQLCKAVRQGNHEYDPESDSVQETEIEWFLDQNVGTRKVVSQDQEGASRAFATWLARRMLAA